MNRSDIYASMAKDIAERLKNLGAITNNDDYDDIIDNANRRQLTGIFSSLSNKDIFSKVADQISNWDGTDNPINSGTNFYIFNVSTENVHYFKSIGVCEDNSHFICVTVDILDGLKNNIDARKMILIEKIWCAIESSEQNKDKFWDLVRNGSSNQNRYVVISNFSPSSDEEKWRLYCYGYLLYCNSNKFPKPPQLNFIPTTTFKSPIHLVTGAKYEQFFDVYDLINESHYCDDILSRYLNMYHIIENMCYRRYLAKISRGNIKRNAFVRRALRQFGRGSKNESEEIPDGIVQLFPNIDTLITGSDFTTDNKNFLKDEYGIIISANPTKKQIAQIIYQLRNSIAHNKSTELHFAYANVEDYSIIIDLIKKLIGKLEPEIINLLSINPYPENDHPLEYKKRNFDLY